jgi:hypothetical protein
MVILGANRPLGHGGGFLKNFDSAFLASGAFASWAADTIGTPNCANAPANAAPAAPPSCPEKILFAKSHLFLFFGTHSVSPLNKSSRHCLLHLIKAGPE